MQKMAFRERHCALLNQLYVNFELLATVWSPCSMLVMACHDLMFSASSTAGIKI